MIRRYLRGLHSFASKSVFYCSLIVNFWWHKPTLSGRGGLLDFYYFDQKLHFQFQSLNLEVHLSDLTSSIVFRLTATLFTSGFIVWNAHSPWYLLGSAIVIHISRFDYVQTTSSLWNPFVHYCDTHSLKAPLGNCRTELRLHGRISLPGIWCNKNQILASFFHLNTLPLGVLLMYVKFLLSVFKMNRRLLRYSSNISTAQYRP